MAYLEAKTTDDALELFDVIMTSELLARSQQQSNADKLSRYARLGKDASRLAAAVSVLLEAQEWDATITIDVLWDAMERVASVLSCGYRWPTSTRSCPRILIRTVSGSRR